MSRLRLFAVVVEHDDSLFPDQGALRSAIDRTLHHKAVGFGPDKPGVVTISVTEIPTGDPT